MAEMITLMADDRAAERARKINLLLGLPLTPAQVTKLIEALQTYARLDRPDDPTNVVPLQEPSP